MPGGPIYLLCKLPMGGKQCVTNLIGEALGVSRSHSTSMQLVGTDVDLGGPWDRRSGLAGSVQWGWADIWSRSWNQCRQGHLGAISITSALTARTFLNA